METVSLLTGAFSFLEVTTPSEYHAVFRDAVATGKAFRVVRTPRDTPERFKLAPAFRMSVAYAQRCGRR